MPGHHAMTPNQQAFQLTELFDALEDVLVWVKDRDGRYCWVNSAFLLQHAQEISPAGEAGSPSVLGKTDYDLSPAFLADQFHLDDEYVLAGNRIVNRIERVGPSMGSSVWNVTNKIPLRDLEGTIIGTAGITRRLGQSGQEIPWTTEFGSVLAYMRDQYRQTITNQELAQVAHMSVRAFERKFHLNFHLTPQKYLRKLRLGEASRALVYGNQSLVEIALHSGFADQSHFTREFRRHFGRTPLAYRAEYARTKAGPVPGINIAAAKQ